MGGEKKKVTVGKIFKKNLALVGKAFNLHFNFAFKNCCFLKCLAVILPHITFIGFFGPGFLGVFAKKIIMGILEGFWGGIWGISHGPFFPKVDPKEKQRLFSKLMEKWGKIGISPNKTPV